MIVFWLFSIKEREFCYNILLKVEFKFYKNNHNIYNLDKDSLEYEPDYILNNKNIAFKKKIKKKKKYNKK